MTRLLLGVSVCVLGCATAGQGAAPEVHAERETTDPPRIETELLDGPVPWTHLAARNDPDAFQFAIVSDRTGGARAGVFESAVSKLNLLQPELVLSVGDMIAGYTKDVAKITAEWNEFDAFIAGLEPPFFRVPGNHDLSNDTMREVWQRRYGPAYYAFEYRNVLFVCLNSMDGAIHSMSEQQLAWLGHTLATHGDVRWTLLFLHSPLWDDFAGVTDAVPYEPVWARVEALLGARNYTAFAGHHHRYLLHQRQSRKLFTLATTGGGSRLRGPEYGEFDQVVWVTMTEAGPLVANLLLGGILPEDVRTEASRAFEEALFRSGTTLPHPVRFAQRFQKGRAELALENPTDTPLTLEFRAEPKADVSVAPNQLTVNLAPRARSSASFELTHDGSEDRALFAVPLAWRAVTDGGAAALSGHTALSAVRTIQAEVSAAPVTVDGALGDWPSLPHEVDAPLQILNDAKAWRGREDSRFRIGIRHDADHVYVAVEVNDDELNSEAGVYPWQQDGIELRIDARPEPTRAHGRGHRDGRSSLLLALSPSSSADDDRLVQEGWLNAPPAGTELACVKTATGFVTEVKLPRAYLDGVHGGRAHELRLNVTVNDRDADGQSQSFWWPDWRSREDVPGSGTVLLNPK